MRVVTFGELMLRLSPPPSPPPPARLFASPELRAGFGGCEANVAVGLVGLRVHTDYVTRLPANPIGDAALTALRAEGVGIDRIVRGPERMGIYFIEQGEGSRATRVVYDRAGSAFACIAPDAIDWRAALAGAAWFHGSGITPALGDGPATSLATAIATARSAGVKVSVDLNYRQALWHGRDPRPLVEPLARDAELLIGNAAAVRAMLGADPDARALAERFRCRRVALTEHEVLSESEHRWSATLYDAGTGGSARSRRHQVRVVDRVGSGDSFAAALIAALLSGKTDAEGVEFAVAAAALKLGVPGDWNRATADEIEQMVRSCT
jgi:2-dehydro-3-deoxygluconokinase